MKDSTFQDAILALCAGEAPRVWSLIVTVFGDLAQSEGDSVSGPLLGAMLSPVGVRPEAMRVALFRLRNEGWIETNKRGREAFHALSARGLQQSAQASETIYASSRDAAADWHMVCYPPLAANDEQARARELKLRGYSVVAAGVYLANSAPRNCDRDTFVIHGEIGAVPDWLSLAIAPQALRDGFLELAEVISQLDLSATSQMTPLEIATLRVLIVHRWRKLVLRLPNVPDTLFGPEFEGGLCRARVLAALDVLPRPSLSLLARGLL